MSLVNPNIFREYDIRGVADKDLTSDIVYRLGRACGTYYHLKGVKKVALGRDCRLSSPSIHDAIARGLVESGCLVLDIGMVPTPVLYYSLFKLDVGGGIQITGSHNPPDNNGFKICLGRSTIYGEQIQEIRKILEAGRFQQSNTGTISSMQLDKDYGDHLLESCRPGPIKRKAVVDAGNGTAGIIAPRLYRTMGVEVKELYCDPDGRFPNHHPDPTIPRNLEALVREVEANKADVGIAFDGDADRIGVVNEKGQIIWGDQLMIIFSREILKERPGATFIGEVKCSQTLFDDIERHGGNPIMWKVGHSLIKAKSKEVGAVLAGEMSGHLFFSDRYLGFDDAIYAGARLLEILTRHEGSLSDRLSDLPPMVNTPEIRVECPDELKFDIVQRLGKEFSRDHKVIQIDGARILFPEGWGLVRASNTQPVLVLRFEARTSEALEKIRNVVEGRLNSLLES